MPRDEDVRTGAPIDSLPILDWFEALYGDVEEGWLALSSRPNSGGQLHTHWHRIDELDRAAADAADRSAHTDVWFGVGVRSERLERGRGGDSDVTSIPGLWLDVDVGTAGHKSDHPLPATVDAALELIASFPEDPTGTISTGGGVHAWWLFKEPLDADEAGQLLGRWAATWAVYAEAGGVHVDNVFDLARIMRLPHTRNHKLDVARLVEMLTFDDHRRYTIDDLDQWLIDAPEPARASASSSLNEQRRTGSEARPGDRYNDTHSCDEVLEQNRWTLGHTDREGNRHYVRPGKERREGTGATVYADNGRCTVFTDATGLPANETFDPWGLYVRLEHAGDFSAAASAMRAAEPRPDPVEQLEQAVVDDSAPDARIHDPCTDLANARRLVDAHGGDIHHVPEWGRWLRWDGRRWARDITGHIDRHAKQVIASMYTEAATVESGSQQRRLVKWWVTSQSAVRLKAMVSVAATEPGVAVEVDELDADPWVLNANNGIIDLRTGALDTVDRRRLVTKLAPVDYDLDARCPTWLAFLERIFGGDNELIGFVQRAVGYSLTGDVTEQVLFFLHGTGANGKSTLLTTLQALFGDYAHQTEPDLLLSRSHDPHPTGVADLVGVRLAVSQEVEQGRRMAEALVKQLTGGDRIKARFMRQDFFEFAPSHKLWLAANHKPEIRGTDHAIWRRMRLIPFEVTIPEHERDRHLVTKLHAELPGILNWALAGCLAWQHGGLGTSTAVTDATEDYRTENDIIAAFLHDSCTVGPDHSVAAGDLRKHYVAWCEGAGERPLSAKALAPMLRDHGFEQRDDSRTRRSYWHGFSLSVEKLVDATHRDPSTHYPRSAPAHDDIRNTPREGSRPEDDRDNVRRDTGL